MGWVKHGFGAYGPPIIWFIYYVEVELFILLEFFLNNLYN